MWVLILVITVNSNVATGSSVYASREACITAKDAITKAVLATDAGWFATRRVSAVCVPQ